MIKKLITGIASLSVALSAMAFDPTAKPITVVIPFAPGGGVDQTFRHFEKYADAKGIKMNGVYKAGADGLIGMTDIANAPNDGYTVSFGTAGTLAVLAIKKPEAKVIPVTGIANSFTAFVVSTKTNITTFNELDSAIKNGSSLKFGFGAPGQKMVLEQLFELAKASKKPIMVPYKGGGPVVVDLVGGHIDVAAVPFSLVKSHIDSGAVRLVAVSDPAKDYPNATVITKRYPAWEDTDGFAFILPGNTDPAIVNTWSRILEQYMNDPAVREHYAKTYAQMYPFGPKTIEKVTKAAVAKLSKEE